MRLLLLACLGGAIGSGCRYLLNVTCQRAFGPAFPWSTLIANITGCFVMGLLAAWLASRAIGASPDTATLRIFLATGILGGFTTFSAFSLDVATLVERGDIGAALGYAGASVGVSLAAVFAGLWLARGVLP
jgi:fluoride exporter